MGMNRAESSDWRNNRKCSKLTPNQADNLFFPKPGGKSKAAKNYCSDCPVIDKCLNEAIALDSMGFWAGTTEGERRRMAEFLGLVAAQMDEFVPEPTRRTRKLRPIRKDQNILGDPLFGLEGPSEADIFLEELSMYGL